MKTKKKKKTEEVGRCLALQWRKQTVYNVCLFFVCIDLFFQLMGVVCCQAVLAQGARPSQPGPRSRAAAQKHVGGGARCGVGGVEEETLLKRCVVPELHPGQASSVWGAAASPGPPFSSPLAGEPGPPHKTWRKGRGWRIKRLFFWWGGGTYQT